MGGIGDTQEHTDFVPGGYRRFIGGRGPMPIRCKVQVLVIFDACQIRSVLMRKADIVLRTEILELLAV